jgi:hypothetical protein
MHIEGLQHLRHLCGQAPVTYSHMNVSFTLQPQRGLFICMYCKEYDQVRLEKGYCAGIPLQFDVTLAMNI